MIPLVLDQPHSMGAFFGTKKWGYLRTKNKIAKKKNSLLTFLLLRNNATNSKFKKFSKSLANFLEISQKKNPQKSGFFQKLEKI